MYVLFCTASCTRPTVKDGWVLYPGAGVEIPLEENWKATLVKGLPLPVIHTEEDHGIQPNLFPVELADGPPMEAMAAFREKEQAQDKELTLLEEGAVRIVTRTVRKGLPLLRIYYALEAEEGSLILAATCAEATSDTYKRAFDRMIERARWVEP
jgi:hypothetical protein